MRNYLPLNALRAFEAAARHMSFSRAAEELCVTPTAISHQIRSLEDFLEAPLFERRSGRLVLIGSAAAALAGLSEGFDRLEAAMLPLSRRIGVQKLAVAASPSFASLWLMPRLRRFVEAAPDIGLSVSTVIDPAHFSENGFDVAICNIADVASRRVEFLMSERILPVCAPHLLNGRPDWRRVAVETLPLIHDHKANERFPTWSRYFERVGSGDRDATAGLHFNQSSLAIEAAIAGHGLLLGRSRLIASALETGHLLAVGDDEAAFEHDYYTVRCAGGAPRPVRLFLDWLADEVRSDDFGASLSTRMRKVERQFTPPLVDADCL